MRLAEHSLHCYRLRYERPVRWSDIVEEAAPFVLLRLRSDTGAVGVAAQAAKLFSDAQARGLPGRDQSTGMSQCPN
jgi:hypothetical protein